MPQKYLASMTGFGRSGGELSSRLYAGLVVRGVNHRYLDIQVRTNLREEMPEMDAAARAVVGRSVARGRVTVQINLQRTKPGTTSVLVNPEAIASIFAQLGNLSLDENSMSTVELRDILALPGLVSISGEELILTDDETSNLERLLDEATSAFVEMRRQEAVRLGEQIRAELDNLRSFSAWFESEMHGIRDRLFHRLQKRLEDLVEKAVSLDPDRLVQEAAIAADRADVAEEIVRLSSHIETFSKRLSGGKTVGRALDFVCQEINRELNTLGSKCRELGIADRLVDAKTATERIREQVQNLE